MPCGKRFVIDARHIFRTLTARQGWPIGLFGGSCAALVIAPLVVAIKLEARDRKAWRAGQFARDL